VQLWSFDLATGARQLEYERRLVGESEGLAAYAGDGGTLHWVIAPGASTSPPPTFGTATSVLLHLKPRGNAAPVGRVQRLSRVRLTVTPARVRAGRRVTLRAVAQATIVGRTAPAEGVRVAVRGVTGYTDARGRATVRIRVPRRGRLVVRASRPGLSPSQVALRVRR
jgi:hypothetical protein